MNRVLLLAGAAFGIAVSPAASAQTTAPAAELCATSLIGTPLTIPRYPAATQKILDEDIAIAAAAMRSA